MQKYFFALLVFAMSCNAQNGKKLSVGDFEKALSENETAVLLDVRTGKEFAERHLGNAVNIDFKSDSFETAIEKIGKNQAVFVYCLSGGRSAKAAERLIAKGFTNVNELQGGILAWTNADKSIVETAGEKGISIDRYLASVTKEKLVLVDFSAVWCAPCKVLKPTVHKVVEKNAQKVDLLEIDIDENSTLADKMHIEAIPLLILYKNGKEVWRNLGVVEKNDLEKIINENS